VINITLNPDEILQGALVGVKRMVNAIGRGNNTINGPDKDRLWHFHVEGALAEMAVAKAANKFWSTGDKDASDVGDWEVRQTPNPHGDLVLRERDITNGKIDHPFILVRGRFGVYEIVGWTKARDGMKDEYWRDPTGGKRPPAWFVPAKKLREFRMSNGQEG
jgi:hypothetical protein